jgi:hypothetical protein
MFEKLVNYFITTTSSETENENEATSDSEIKQHSFYICSILMRQMCSAATSTPSKTQLVYLEQLLDTCLKFHKKIMKHVKKNKDKARKISSFYVDFVKSYVFNSVKLNNLVSTQADPVKFCKDMIKLFSRFDKQANSLELDFSFVHQRNYEADTMDVEFDDSANKFDHSNNYMLKTLANMFNSLNIYQFKQILEYIGSELTESAAENDYNRLIKMTEIIEAISCNLELHDSLKEDLFVFMQKFLIQLPPVYSNMKLNNKIDEMITLLGHQSTIASSKYVSNFS